jgi:hypothetical protein
MDKTIIFNFKKELAVENQNSVLDSISKLDHVSLAGHLRKSNKQEELRTCFLRTDSENAQNIFLYLKANTLIENTSITIEATA